MRARLLVVDEEDRLVGATDLMPMEEACEQLEVEE